MPTAPRVPLPLMDRSLQQCTHPASIQSVLMFRRFVSVYHESKLLWWNAQECQLQIFELMSSANPCIGSPNLPHRGTWHVLLCQTDLAAQIWPCLPSQPVALLRCNRCLWMSSGVAHSPGFAFHLVLAGLTPVAYVS